MLTLEQVKEAVNAEHEYDADEEPSEGSDLIQEECEFTYEGHKFTYEEQFGGEGQGDDYWIVFSVTSLADAGDVVYYKCPGWYQSHNGAELEWDNLFQVAKKKKTITVWDKSK